MAGPPEYGEPPPRQTTTVHEYRGPSLGTVLFGGFLILFGILWLLDRTDTVDLSWGVLLPGILVLVGLALLIQSRRGSHDGLITIGVILTVILTFMNLTNVEFDATIGQDTSRPAGIEQLQTEYSVGIGQQTLDLTQVDFPAGDTMVKASSGIGQVVVDVPENVAIEVRWNVGVGSARIFGEEKSGIGQEGVEASPDFATAQQRLILELSVGIGSVRVNQ